MTQSKLLTYDGETQSILDWALDYGITPATIKRRLKSNWPVSRAITTPMRTKPGDKLKGAYLNAVTGEQPIKKAHVKTRRPNDIYLTFNGQERSLGEWAKEYGLKHATLRHRIKQGWPIDRALNKAVSKNSRSSRGVVSNIRKSAETGERRNAQETPKIDFSNRKAS